MVLNASMVSIIALLMHKFFQSSYSSLPGYIVCTSFTPLGAFHLPAVKQTHIMLNRATVTLVFYRIPVQTLEKLDEM